MRIDADIVHGLLAAIELKDRITAAHTWRVVLYTRALAEAFRIEGDLLRRITFAAALHDVGKIDIPDALLAKPGELTPEEFSVVMTHTTLGHERLIRMGEDDPVLLNLVRFHHERWDGKGYPDGLRGEEIPLGPRFFAVIDTFDALTSVRPYRRVLASDAVARALEVIRGDAGTHFWPDAVEAFLELHRAGRIGWIQQHFSDGAPVPVFTLSDATDFDLR